MTDSFAPPRQRPAPPPDRLSNALSAGPGEPVSAEISLADAIEEAAALLDEADRGDLSPWQLGRAIDLARQFPASEKLQISVGRLTRILSGAAAAAACWRDMLGRFPDSTRILARYAGILRELHGRDTARRIVDGYIGDPRQIDDPGKGLRAARAFIRLGDRQAGVALLARLVKRGTNEELSLPLAQWLEENGDVAAAEALLSKLPSSPAADRARKQLAARKVALRTDEIANAGSASASVRAIERMIGQALECRRAHPPRYGGPLGSVAIIGSTLGGGGAERQLVTTALGIARLPGRRVAGPLTVYCRKLDARRGNDFYLPMLEAAGIRVVDYRRVPRFGGDAEASLLSEQRELIALLPPHMREGTERLTDLLRHDAPDIVQIWQDGTIIATGLAALLAGVPRILLGVRTMPPTERIDRMRPEQHSLYRGLLAAPGVTLTANSGIAARAYEAWLDLDRGRVAVIPNGVEPLPTNAESLEVRRWTAFDEKTGPGFVLGGVMRFDDNKRPLEWLAIAAEFAAELSDARFILVGDGPLRAAAEAFAHRRGIAARTLFVGRSKSVGFWLEHFDALALTSRHEGTPNVLVEAQLAGVPVVTTRAGGAPDAVAPFEANLVLAGAERPDRPTAARHLARLSRRPKERTAADAAEIRGWASRFSVPEMIERTVELFGAPR